MCEFKTIDSEEMAKHIKDDHGIKDIEINFNSEIIYYTGSLPPTIAANFKGNKWNCLL